MRNIVKFVRVENYPAAPLVKLDVPFYPLQVVTNSNEQAWMYNNGIELLGNPVSSVPLTLLNNMSLVNLIADVDFDSFFIRPGIYEVTNLAPLGFAGDAVYIAVIVKQKSLM